MNGTLALVFLACIFVLSYSNVSDYLLYCNHIYFLTLPARTGK